MGATAMRVSRVTSANATARGGASAANREAPDDLALLRPIVGDRKPLIPLAPE